MKEDLETKGAQRALAGCRVGFVMRRFIECLLELCPVLEDND